MSGETLVSTAFLDKPPPGRQTTEAELWGVLPIQQRADDEWGHFSFLSADTEAGMEEEEPTIHEGLRLDGLSDVCVKSVAVGGGHVILLAEGGFALAYGRNHRGQLGIGDWYEREAPERVLFTGCLASAPLTVEPPETPDGTAQPLCLGSSDQDSEEPTEASAWSIAAVACGNDHTLFLARHPTSGSRVFACGASESLGLEGITQDQMIPLGIRQLAGVAAIAARKDASCCAAPALAQARDGSVAPSVSGHLLYFWGEVSCCLTPCYHPEPTPLYRVPRRIEALGMGAFFGLALDEGGTVYAWGDGTYGELGGAEAVPTDTCRSQADMLTVAELPVPGCVVLPSDVPDRDAGAVEPQVSTAHSPRGPMVSVGGSSSKRLSQDSSQLSSQFSLRPNDAPGLAAEDARSALADDPPSSSFAAAEASGTPADYLPSVDSAAADARSGPADDPPYRPSFGSSAAETRGAQAEEPPPADPVFEDVRGVPAEEPLPPCDAPHECAAERRLCIVDVACGERHSLLLDEYGRVFAFGENLAGQCGVPEVVGAGHVTGNTVPRPRLVPMEGPRRSCSGSRQGPPRPYELGARVFAGSRHSAMVTRDHRLYIWGHPANRKLGHAGFNPDGTEAGDRPSKKRPPGVAVRSALRDAVRRPRFVYSLLHRRVRALGLGEECTIIVTGDGASGAVPGENDSHEDYPQRDGSFVVPVLPTGSFRHSTSL